MSDFSELHRLALDLQRVPQRFQPRAVMALRKTAFDVEADAKLAAPVDTGNLQNSISTSIDGVTAEVGPTAEYGIYVEDGTSVMAPQPYLGPAFDRRVPAFEDAIAKLASEDMF